MNLTINKLPTKTWNRLNMNETNISLEGKFKSHVPSVDTDEAQVIYKDNYDGDLLNTFNGELEDFTKDSSTYLIKTPKNVFMENPVILNYNYENDEHAVSRLFIHACENSVIKIVLVYRSLGDIDISAMQTYVYAEKNACVKIYLAQLLSDKSICLNNITGVCEENANVKLTRLDLGAAQTYSDVEIDLMGNDSRFKTEIGYHAVENQFVDMNYASYHYGKNTECLMAVNGTLEENSKKMFRGTIDFKQGCAGSRGTENENVLLLGEEMSNGTIPLILCAEEDVEGNHGASIGKLDEKILFYLGSRGISEHEAQNIIAMSRIENICNKFPNKGIREEIKNFELGRGITHESKL